MRYLTKKKINSGDRGQETICPKDFPGKTSRRIPVSFRKLTKLEAIAIYSCFNSQATI